MADKNTVVGIQKVGTVNLDRFSPGDVLKDPLGNPLRSHIENFVGDGGTGGVNGLVPAPAAGDAALNKVLSADGTWVAVSSATEYKFIVASKDFGATVADVSHPSFLHENGVNDGLRNAIDAAGFQNPIFIRPGTYEGAFFPSANLHGSGLSATKLKPQLSATNFAMQLYYSKNLSIEFPNTGGGDPTKAAVRLYGTSENISIQDAFGATDHGYLFSVEFRGGTAGGVKTTHTGVIVYRYAGAYAALLDVFNVDLVGCNITVGNFATQTGVYALYVGHNTGENTFLQCQFIVNQNAAGWSVALGQIVRTRWVECFFDRGIKFGVNLLATAPQDGFENTFFGCEIQQSWLEQAVLLAPLTATYGYDDTNFIGNRIFGPVKITGDPTNIETVGRAVFSGNATMNFYGYSYEFYNTSNVSVDGGLFFTALVDNCRNIMFGPALCLFSSLSFPVGMDLRNTAPTGQFEGTSISVEGLIMADLDTASPAGSTGIKAAGLISPKFSNNQIRMLSTTFARRGIEIIDCANPKASGNVLDILNGTTWRIRQSLCLAQAQK